MEHETIITLTADIVAAHVSNNNVAVGDVGNLVQRVHAALSGLGRVPAVEEAPPDMAWTGEEVWEENGLWWTYFPPPPGFDA